jgi:inner membrane protein involved in colicin E2 resistance
MQTLLVLAGMAVLMLVSVLIVTPIMIKGLLEGRAASRREVEASLVRQTVRQRQTLGRRR